MAAREIQCFCLRQLILTLTSLGGFRFLVPGICQAEPVSAYSSIRKRLQDNPQAKVLDLGCCFGHDARQLLKDGVRADQIVACDLVPDLITLGFELFGDKRDQGHNRGMTWEKVDIFNKDDVERIKQPHGYDAIYVGSFLHLFPFEWQQKAMAAVNSLLSEEKGSVVWGRQIGVELGKAGAMERISKPYRGPTGIDANADGTQQSPFFHDEATLQKLFDGASHDGWEADVKTYEFSNERGFQKGEGEQMIAPGLADAMKRLAFAFSRK